MKFCIYLCNCTTCHPKHDEIIKDRIYEKDSDISYSACGLPYFIGEDYINRKNLVPRNAEWFKKRFDINIKTEHEVKSIDTENKTLEILNLLTGEKFTDRYDILLLATGAKAVIPEIAGFDSKNVFSLRNIKNGESIKKYITENSPKSAVIIGSGFIGIEMAENLVKRGIKVSIIEEKISKPKFSLITCNKAVFCFSFGRDLI